MSKKGNDAILQAAAKELAGHLYAAAGLRPDVSLEMKVAVVFLALLLFIAFLAIISRVLCGLCALFSRAPQMVRDGAHEEEEPALQ